MSTPARPTGSGLVDRWGGRLRQRWAEGRGRRTHPGRVLLLWAALLAVLSAAVVFLFFFSAAFVVKEVTVTGARPEVQAEVARLAQIPTGRPLARVSEGRVSERVLADKRVASVKVEKDWPSGVTLAVTEREPAVALRGGGKTWVADASGAVFEQVDRPSRRLPLISIVGDPAELAPATVSGLAELWRLRLDPDVIEGSLSAPKVAEDGAVTMTVDNLTLEWGQPTDNTKKWQIVEAVVGQEAVDPQGPTKVTIDLRSPDTPVVSGLPEKLDLQTP